LFVYKEVSFNARERLKEEFETMREDYNSQKKI
jgi:hypothetical protein